MLSREPAPRFASCRRMGNRSGLAVVLGGLFVVLAGCEPVPPAARKMLLTASANYGRAEYAAAVQSATTFMQHFGSSPVAPEALYVRAISRVQLGDREAARSDFVACVENTNRDDLRAYARTMLGHLTYEDGNHAAAVSYYADALGSLPNRPPTDEALYRYGACLQHLGRWDEAKAPFSRLLHEFQDSAHVAAARRRFAWPHPWFAIQCGAFGRVDNANQLAADLSRKGLSAKATFAELDGKGLWRVLSGQYPTYAAALADLPRVRAIQPGALIVP